MLPRIEEEAQRRAKVLLEAHQRVRAAARLTHVAHQIEPKLPPDVLGIYVYLPVAGGQKYMRPRDVFTTIHTEGGLLPSDLLQRIASGDKGWTA